ncbi:protein of unknown function [Hymenobacter gelipurpurascens]|uniref:DUF4272 domain-containing protein n=1 Tax=Hymenobacter gelipurpurascens TaxID=89968 RepID=A0A212UGN3_9BACT|nr:DUF4272 domain-containing protein [Hymenobacter gelipurpurascens]SNC77330.1 protein of unknown function [Hymenobacter gelipurpurascens]
MFKSLKKLFGSSASNSTSPAQSEAITDEFRQRVKAQSEAKVLALDGRVCDWLPLLDIPELRDIEAIRGRISVVNALINISFQAPVAVIREWLTTENLLAHVSPEEAAILAKKDEQLTDQELTNLRWNLESLWAMMWATQMVHELDPVKWCGDNMASLLPNLEKGEGNEKLAKVQALRPAAELYQMLDFYYRLHWYCVDERIHGRAATVSESLVYERRKALEWIYSNQDEWDTVEMNT